MEERIRMKVDGDIKKYYHYAFPMQAVLVTCNDKKGQTNIITLAWHTPISRTPPLYGISIAPKRFSHKCIEVSKEFVINFIPYSLVQEAHFCGTHTGRLTDKVCTTGLTLISEKKLHTPMIKEAYAALECKLVDKKTVGDHVLFIGEVVSVLVDDNAFKDDLLRTDRIHPLYYIGENSYTTLDRAKRKKF
jgi:flavin reductase (DIM6/NTAB) family NADH-FMN oxidoreductase RutF